MRFMSSASAVKEKIRITKGSMFNADSRFAGIEPFETKLWLASPTMHGDEQKWVDEAITTNWVSTVGANINEIERITAEKIGRKYV